MGLAIFLIILKKNDIWTTTNQGINWNEILLPMNKTKWSERFGYQSFVYDDKIWILGGLNRSLIALNDIWYSDDKGITWTEVPLATGTAKWSGRYRHQSFIYDDKIWILGGNDGNSKKKMTSGLVLIKGLIGRKYHLLLAHPSGQDVVDINLLFMMAKFGYWADGIVVVSTKMTFGIVMTRESVGLKYLSLLAKLGGQNVIDINPLFMMIRYGY